MLELIDTLDQLTELELTERAPIKAAKAKTKAKHKQAAKSRKINHKKRKK